MSHELSQVESNNKSSTILVDRISKNTCRKINRCDQRLRLELPSDRDELLS